MTKLSPEQSAKLAAGRMLAVQKAPYLSVAVLSLQPQIVPNGTFSEAGTFACDEWGNLYIEPAAIERYTAQDVMTGLLHEAFHCYVQEHAQRCKHHGLEKEMYNTAADAEINDDLAAMGCKMLPTDVLPEQFEAPRGRTAEEYYAILKARQKEGKPSPKRGSACGGCSGNPLPNEPKEAPKASQGRPPVAVVRAQVAQAVREASKAGHGVPEGLRTWADDQQNPRVIPWEDRLARLVRVGIGNKAGAVDYHFSRPSRRQAGLGHGPGTPRLPGLVAPVPRVAVLFDTSGSMLGEGMGQGVPQVERIVKAVGAHIELVNCDEQVQGAAKVSDLAGVRRVLTNGGRGTDMQPGFDRAEKARPDVIVCVTDGQFFREVKRPRSNVIWLLTGGYPGDPAPWGSRIYVDPKAAQRARAGKTW